MSQSNSNERPATSLLSRPSFLAPKTPTPKATPGSSATRSASYNRPATAMGASSAYTAQSSGRAPPLPAQRSSQQSSSGLSPHAASFDPRRSGPPNNRQPDTPTSPTMAGYPQVPPPMQPSLVSCCAIGYEISNLSLLTWMGTQNDEAVSGGGLPAQGVYERFLLNVSRIINMQLWMVLPPHTNPLLCIIVFCDATDLFDIMHFPVNNNFLRIRQNFQIPVQGHLRKMFFPKARVLGPDVMSGTGGEVSWR